MSKPKTLLQVRDIESWSDLLAPLVNMIKEKKSFWSFILKNHKNLTFHWTKTIENGGKSHYEINVFLKYTLDTIIGIPLEILMSKI